MSEISSEISEPSDTKAKETSKSSELDPGSVRTTKPGTKRLFLALSVLFSFLLGFPFLWKSVEIYRSSLPFTEISELESNPSLSFPCRFQAIFLNFNSNFNPNRLQLSILNHITKLTSSHSQCGSCTNNPALSVTVDSSSHCVQTNFTDNLYRCGTITVIDFHQNDEDVDEFLESVMKGKNVYSVVVVNGDRVGEGVKAVVGKYRHGWIVGRVDDEAEVVLRVAEIFVKVFVDGGREKGLIHEEFMPVGADGRIVLSFNLLNAEPNDWVNGSSLSAAYYS